MKNILSGLSMLLAIIVVAASCKTEMVTPVDIFALETGGYMRIISGTTCVSSANVTRTNMAGTNLTVIHEAVTPDKGAGFTSYVMEIRHVGTATTAYVPLKTVNASDYKPDGTTGYPRHTLTVTGADALAATKLDTNTVKAGSRFEIKGTMKLSNGKSFDAVNTSPNITGGAFYCSPFTYRLNVN
jgi:hypothetical protein